MTTAIVTNVMPSFAQYVVQAEPANGYNRFSHQIVLRFPNGRAASLIIGARTNDIEIAVGTFHGSNPNDWDIDTDFEGELGGRLFRDGCAGWFRTSSEIAPVLNAIAQL